MRPATLTLALLSAAATTALATGTAFTGHSVTDASGNTAAAMAVGPIVNIFGSPHSQLDGTWTKHWSLEDVYYTDEHDDMFWIEADGSGVLMVVPPGVGVLPGVFPFFVPFTWHL